MRLYVECGRVFSFGIVLLVSLGAICSAATQQPAARAVTEPRQLGIGVMWATQLSVAAEYHLASRFWLQVSGGYGAGLLLADVALEYALAARPFASFLVYGDGGLVAGSAADVFYGGPLVGAGGIVRFRVLDHLTIDLFGGVRYVLFSVADMYRFGAVVPRYGIGFTYWF